MRQAQQQKAPRGSQVARTGSQPAPIGGWNTRDSVAAMDEKDAVILTNWFPQPSQVKLRLGFQNWVTGIPGQVETLMSYVSATAAKIFAINAAGNIYDVTTAGAVGAAVVTGLSNGRWQYVNFGTGSGLTYLVAVNGTDAPRLYDGSTWSTTAITGVTQANLIHVEAHKRRLWFVEKNTFNAWYLPVNSIAGAASLFDLSPNFTRGGSLMAMATWTLDGGYGMDDHAVFISTEGEVAVYRGTDPAVAANWQLVGVYNQGSPIGRRCYLKYGGDLLLLTRDGVMPLSSSLVSSRTSQKTALSDKIQQSVAEAVVLYGASFGWEMELFPGQNMLLVNIPVAAGIQQQFVMNTITGAWSNFSGWPANCWCLHRDEIYFGANTYVGKAWKTQADNGANIVAPALGAFNYFGSASALKNWRLTRPLLAADGPIGVILGLVTDFDTTAPQGVPSFAASGAGLWDVAQWDAALWGGTAVIKKEWQTVYGLGYCAAIYLIVTSNAAACTWPATDFVYEGGGIL